jgi:hypothetical protein
VTREFNPLLDFSGTTPTAAAIERTNCYPLTLQGTLAHHGAQES